MLCSKIVVTVTSAMFDKNVAAAAYMAIIFLLFYNAGFEHCLQPIGILVPD